MDSPEDTDADGLDPDPPTRTADLAGRLDAVERALTDGDAVVADLSDAAAVESRLTRLESEVETLLGRVDELDAATQAVRGYAGGISAVNESVERRADLALATVERLERRLDPEPGLTVERLAGASDTDGIDADVGSPDPDPDSDRATDAEEPAGTTDGAGRSFATRLRDAL